MKKMFLVLGILILALAACQPQPDEVTLKLAEAINAKDLEGALALFDEEAVVDAGPIFVGKAAIRGWLQELINLDYQIEPDNVEVDGDKVVSHTVLSWSELAERGIESLDGTSEFTVQDGHVISMVFTYSEASEAALDEGAAMKEAVLADLEMQNSGQIDMELPAFADDATFIADGRPYFLEEQSGKEAIASSRRGQAAGGLQDEPTGELIAIGNQLVFPSRISLDYFQDLGVFWITGTDKYVFEDGMIQSHSWTIDDEGIAALEAVLPPPMTLDDLAGTWEWSMDDQSYRHLYRADGSYEIQYLTDGEWLTRDQGRLEVDGALLTGYTLTLISDEESEFCAEGAVGRYEVALTDAGILALVNGKDECQLREPLRQRQWGNRADS